MVLSKKKLSLQSNRGRRSTAVYSKRKINMFSKLGRISALINVPETFNLKLVNDDCDDEG